MANDLQLATTRQFNGITLNCYREAGQEDPQNFWATREQIGQLLGYKKPADAIRFIHKRNRERLDMFSKIVELHKYFDGVQDEPPFRNSPVATVYNFKGLLEICRYSNQPNAHKVIDVLWDIADEIRKTGAYAVNGDTQTLIRRLEVENNLLREKVNSLIEQIETDRSFTVLGRVISLNHGFVSFSEAGKVLAQNGVNIGPNKLLKLAREKGLLCKCKGRRWNQPTQKAIKDGTAVLVLNFGSKGTAYLTAKGLKTVTDQFVDQIYPLLALIEGGEAVNG